MVRPHSIPARWALLTLRFLTRVLPEPIGKPIRRSIRDRLALPDADVVFVSFPKSGRTWVRVMISHLYHLHFGVPGNDIFEFDNLHKLDPRVPKILFTHDGEPWQTPEQLKADKGDYAGRKVVLLVRDPIDTVVSRHFHVRHRSDALRHKNYATMPIEEFVWAPLGGLPTIVAYMNHWQHARQHLQGVLMVRYEDFRREPAATLARLAAFLGLDASETEVTAAVDYAAFDNLRKLEEQKALGTARLGAREKNNPDSLKVRRGKVKGYRDYFTPEAAARMEAYVRDQLSPEFGYGATDAPDSETGVSGTTGASGS